MRNLIAKLEKSIAENKNCVKTYKSYAAAEKAAEKHSEDFETYNDTKIQMIYIIVCIPSTGHWTPIFNLSTWSASSGQGTYLGFFAVRGYMSI